MNLDPSPSETREDRGPYKLVGRTVSHYRVEEKLGGGGMGVVYRAVDLKLDRHVALKFLPPHLSVDDEAKERFIHEAKSASALDHPHICTIHEIDESEDGRLFIAMAYYAGETLKKKIERGPLPLGEAVEYAIQIADGLARAHAKNVVHRDIKPANVMVTEDGAAKIVDFGLAKIADVNLTRAGMTMGTAAYMSPEQAHGADVDHRSDLWSLGVVLFEMLTGERAFRGDYEDAVIYSILHFEPDRVSDAREDVSPELAHVVAKCLEKDRATRYQTAEALMADLKAVREHEAASFSGLSVTTGPSEWVRRLTWRHGTALAAVAVAVALSVSVLSRSQVPEALHLAVLPFQTIGDAPDIQAFSHGLMQTLTSNLMHIDPLNRALWVVPAGAINGPMTPREARDQFGVTLVIDGSIQREADRVRLTLNLIDAGTERLIESQQLDRSLTSTLALQDQVTLTLARMLRVELDEQERESLARGGTIRPHANEYYLRGLGYLRNRQTVQDVEVAIGLFEEAVRQDSLFALAYAGLGEAYWQKFNLTEDIRWVEEAERHSQHALSLNDRLAPVYGTLGLIYSGKNQHDDALRAFQQALEIDPLYEEAYRRRGSVYARLGRVEEAEAEYRKAIALIPDYWGGYNSIGAFFLRQGRYEEAVAEFQLGLERAPSNLSLLNNLGVAYWELQQLDEAVATFERVRQVDPLYGTATTNLATAYFFQGQFERAAQLYEDELTRRPKDYALQGYLADSYYWIPGARAQAEAAYRKAIERARVQLSVSEDDPEMLSSMAGYFARLGMRDSARVYLSQVESVLQPDQASVSTAIVIGDVYEALGDRRRALEWIESALQRGGGWMQLEHSPWLRDLRSDPELVEPVVKHR